MRTSNERGIALITTLLVMMLISALLVGFTAIVMSDQRYRFIDRDRSQAFYAASGAMEKMTADLGNLFFANLAPSSSQVTALTAASPSIAGVTYTTTSAPGPLPASLLSSYTCGPAPLTTVTKGTIGYTIMYCTDAGGNPVATSTGVIKTGAFQGLSAAQTPYQLDVTARTSTGGEVHLVRTIESVAIPVFQFGMFSDVDLAFFAGPNFNFGGRVHTNGNLFLAQGNDTTLTLNSQVTAVGEVVRQNYQNGFPIATAPATGTVSLAKSPGVFRTLAANEGSVTGALASSYNEPTWHTISLSTYNSYIRNSRTGAKALNLPVITAGGANPDLIRRPLPNENTTNVMLYGERLYPKASLRILLSDTAADITGLPTVTATAPISLGTLVADSNWNTTPPANYLVSATNTGVCTTAPCLPIARTPGANAMTVRGAVAANWTTLPVSNPLPVWYKLPLSLTLRKGATSYVLTCTGKSATQFLGCASAPAIPAGGVNGGVTIEAAANTVNSIATVMQIPVTVNVPTGNPTTVTVANGATAPFSPGWFYVSTAAGATAPQILVQCTGYDNSVVTTPSFTGCDSTMNGAGGQTPALSNGWQINTNGLATAQLGTIGGYIKIEKQDTAGVWTDITAAILRFGIGASNFQATLAAGNAAGGQNPTGHVCADPTPNAIIRIQRLRNNGGGTLPTDPGGGCNYAASINAADYWPNALFDAREGLQRDNAPAGTNVILGGVMYYIAIDAQNLAQWFRGSAPYNAAPYNAVIGTNAIQNNNGFTVYFSDRRNNRNNVSLPTACSETAEYGYEDFVNPLSAAGAPNGTLDTGEDVNGSGTLDVYGGLTNFNGACNAAPTGAVLPLTTAATPLTSLRPGEAQGNRSIIFRHALMLMDGRNLRPNTGITGLTIVSENPVYVQGDWNANDTGTPANLFAGNGFTGLNAATAVLADSVTLLSNNWNDELSFTNPYNPGNNGRQMLNAVWYRLAIAAGKGPAFPWPAAGAPPADFGTDGGAHNFLRLLEDGNGQTINYWGSIATFYYNRQAVGTYKCCTTVYQPPGLRAFAFDLNFATPALLPPNTPVFRDMNAVGFSQEIRPGR